MVSPAEATGSSEADPKTAIGAPCPPASATMRDHTSAVSAFSAPPAMTSDP